MTAPILIGYCWACFIIVWLVSMFFAKRTLNRPGGAWLLRTLMIVVIIVIATHVGISPALFWVPVVGPAWQMVGVVLTALGIALAIWARFYLGRNWGMPQSIKENPELVTTGPYAYIRNPIYTGMLFAMFGSALASGPWWFVVFIVAGSYFIWSAYAEEKIMAKTFPDHYPTYKARTWALVPFIF